MANQLTTGAIESIMTGGKVDKPILQVLGQKKIAGSGGTNTERYRLLLSDGVHSHSQAMLATQLNDKIASGEMDTFAVIQLNKYLCNTIQQDRRVMILLDVNIITPGNRVGSKIGNPVSYKAGQTTNQDDGATNANQQQAQPLQNNNANNKPAPPQQSPPNKGNFYQNKAGNKPYSIQDVPNTPGGTPTRVHPINSLTPYQNRWTIRARVTNKSNIRTWSNSKGEGKLFSMNLLDDSGEIKATAFKDQVDKFYEMIELNKVYYLTKGQLKTADKRYSSVNNDYEMTFSNDTQMWACEDEADLPTLSFNFVPVSNLESQQPNTTVDIVGVVKEAQDVQKIMSKNTNREITKRDITLVDESKVQVRMTLWGQDAEKFDSSGFPVLAVKGCKLSDWGGRSLSALSSSQILLNPDIPEAHRLRGWYDSVGHSADYSEYKSEGGAGGAAGHSTNWKTFSEVKNETPAADQAIYYSSKGTVVFMRKENCMYMACPSTECNKKVVDLANGLYRCEKCAKEYPNYKWRMILSCNIADFSDNQWATCFQETAEMLLGRAADELGSLRESNESEFDRVFSEANFKPYIFKFRAKMETYNDESRLKTVCVQATPVNFPDYNKKLIGDIERMLAQ